MSKPLTEAQNKAIRNMMANRRRQLRDTSAGSYPKWKPGMTTEYYIRIFAIGGRHVLPFGPRILDKRLGWIEDLSHLNRPAPFYTEPDEVQFELIEE